MIIRFIIVAALATFVYWFIQKRLRRGKLLRLTHESLSERHRQLLREHMPLYNRLPADLKQRLEGLVCVFLNTKNFFGSQGLEITDAMRLTVAGNASLLRLGSDEPTFPGSNTILLYPDTFASESVTYDGEIAHEGVSARSGESWKHGPVILSWADVMRGINNPADGHNVVIHEYAHKLDEEDGTIDGLPILREHADYSEWARVMTKEFADLIKRVERNKNRVLDAYGATSPPEFFAVATEAFFEKGKDMRSRMPSLYQQLKRYYGVDPAGWDE